MFFSTIRNFRTIGKYLLKSHELERRSRSGDSAEIQIYFIPATRYINSAYRSVVKREKPNGYFIVFLKGNLFTIQKTYKKISGTSHLFSLHNRAVSGTRTRDPWLGKPMLYQLSYYREMWCKAKKNIPISQDKKVAIIGKKSSRHNFSNEKPPVICNLFRISASNNI